MNVTVQYVLGFCPLDLLALAGLAAMCTALAVYNTRQRSRERELEEELADRMAEQALRDTEPWTRDSDL